MTKKEILKQAEAYFLMSLSEKDIPPNLIAEGTYERRMWVCLFEWAGWN